MQTVTASCISDESDATREEVACFMRDIEAARYMSGFCKGWKHLVPVLLRRGVSEGGMWVLSNEREGVCGMVQVEGLPDDCPEGKGAVTIEYFIKRSAWGQGLGTSAARICLDKARSLQATACVAMILPDNVHSARIVSNLGFSHTDTITYNLNGADRTAHKYVLVL